MINVFFAVLFLKRLKIERVVYRVNVYFVWQIDCSWHFRGVDIKKLKKFF